MIRIVYAFKNNCPLKNFLYRQLNEANLENYPVSMLSIDLLPSVIERYNLDKWHTVIFKDYKDEEIYRLEGPFDSKEIEEALQIAKGILSNKMKGGTPS